MRDGGAVEDVGELRVHVGGVVPPPAAAGSDIPGVDRETGGGDQEGHQGSDVHVCAQSLAQSRCGPAGQIAEDPTVPRRRSIVALAGRPRNQRASMNRSIAVTSVVGRSRDTMAATAAVAPVFTTGPRQRRGRCPGR